MRYVILLLMLCLSATAGEDTNIPNSLLEFSKEVGKSYEKKDWNWIQKHTETNGVPVELVSALSQEMKEFFGSGDLQVTDGLIFPFKDYTPKHPKPGELKGRKLRFVTKPTHWIIINGQCSTPTDFGWKLEIAVFQKNGHWKIAGITYAD